MKIIQGDCVEELAKLPADSVDAIVTDPPYAIEFMARSWDKMDTSDDPAMGYYLAGLVDGEGCFRVQEHSRGSCNCSFQLKLRKDDRAILERIHKFVGHGTLTTDNTGTNPQTKYVVQDKAGCLHLVALFSKFPLRAKKAADFWAWAEAVVYWNEMERGNRWHGPGNFEPMKATKRKLTLLREYRDVPWTGHSFCDWTRVWAEQALRVLKPGGHMLVFGGSRTYHAMAMGVELAGFEIRDQIQWIYGSGFPKSHNVGKAIDKAAGAERDTVGWNPSSRIARSSDERNTEQGKRAKTYNKKNGAPITAPATDEAKQWDGWGTALKPAHEPIVVARKPFKGTVAANVLRNGTGAINVDACRVGAEARFNPPANNDKNPNTATGPATKGGFGMKSGSEGSEVKGRWPANFIHDGSEEATEGLGKAARFFYCAKASKKNRGEGNTHPTVKPTDLMRYLCRLVTPPGGTVLDPFTGSGSTGKAALLEGFDFIGIEKDEDYCTIASKRLSERKAHEETGISDD